MNEERYDARVLLAGCGSAGRRHARILSSLGVANIWVCDPNPQQVRSLQMETPSVLVRASYEAGLADKPDAVFVLTPPRMHVPMIRQALAANCHVFCEKPLSDSREGVQGLVERIAAGDRKVMVGLCFRYHEGLLRAKAMLDAGEIGRLVSIRALMGEHLPDVRPDYRSLFTAKYSGAFDLMHDIDLALWYADRPVAEVECIYGSLSDIGVEAPDVVEMLIRFESRCVASVHLDFFQRPRRRQMELIGTQGVIIVEFASWDACTVSVFRASTAEWSSETIPTRRDDMFTAEDREFLMIIRDDLPVRLTVQEAAKSVDVVARAQATGAGAPTHQEG